MRQSRQRPNSRVYEHSTQSNAWKIELNADNVNFLLKKKKNFFIDLHLSLQGVAPASSVQVFVFSQKTCAKEYGITVKKVSDFPVPSRDFTNQTLPGQAEFGLWRRRENR
jgi:hypothetical protein